MGKVHFIENQNEKLVLVHCPGCDMWHPFRVRGVPGQPIWTWNGSNERPTFSPSMLVNKDVPYARCHSFVRDGQIQFLGDSFHDLKGQTVELPDLDSDGGIITRDCVEGE
jgi:hypothetical protein